MFTLSAPVIRRRERRSPMLLAAAVAMAVPSLLAAACSAPSSSASSASGANSASTASSASNAARTGAAAIQADDQRAKSRAAKASNAKRQASAERRTSAQAVQLLTQSAQAAVAMSYQGEEISTRWSNGTSTELVSEVWHASGGQTTTSTLATGASFTSQPYLSADTDGQAPEGVLGVTAPLVQLIEQHFVVVYAGTGTADNRAAQVVEAWRSDGSLAARFWLDDATKLPLEREVYDASSHVISQDVFIDVRFADQVPAPKPAEANLKGPWTDLMSRTQLLALRSEGWVVPGQLPGGLTLFTGAEDSTSSGLVIDLGYSDGLNVISLFEQHGELADNLDGWQQTTVDGHTVYLSEPDQHSLTWAGRGLVYTMLADAPDQTVDAAVGTLPHDQPPGFWKRISRGLSKLAHLAADPFR